MRKRLFFALTTSILAAGCATVSTRQLEQVPAQVHKGVTTSSEVLALLGKPDHRRVEADGETWIYGKDVARSPGRVAGDVAVGQAIGIGSGFIPVPYVGTAISSALSLGGAFQSAKPSATIQFDHKEVVRDYAVDIP